MMAGLKVRIVLGMEITNPAVQHVDPVRQRRLKDSAS